MAQKKAVETAGDGTELRTGHTKGVVNSGCRRAVGRCQPRGRSAMDDKDRATGDRPLRRRGFLATGLGAGLGAVALHRSGAAEADGPPAATGTRTPALPVRPFGKTGLRLPILAFGGSAMVTRWQPTYGPQLSFEQRVAMVRHAFDSGIRYFDTAPNYTESESIIGAATPRRPQPGLHRDEGRRTPQRRRHPRPRPGARERRELAQAAPVRRGGLHSGPRTGLRVSWLPAGQGAVRGAGQAPR